MDAGLLRRRRDFRLLVLGQAISEAGSMLTFVAVPFQVYELKAAAAVHFTVHNAAFVGGPALAGVLIASAGLEVTYALDAAASSARRSGTRRSPTTCAGAWPGSR
jgi:hypothetical protein